MQSGRRFARAAAESLGVFTTAPGNDAAIRAAKREALDELDNRTNRTQRTNRRNDKGWGDSPEGGGQR